MAVGVVGVLAVLAERVTLPGGATSACMWTVGLAATAFGVVLVGRCRRVTVPTSTARDASIVAELASAAAAAAVPWERDTLLDVLGSALAHRRLTPASDWPSGDMAAIRALVAIGNPARAADARFIEAALELFVAHGGQRELEIARALAQGPGDTANAAHVRDAARGCAEALARRMAAEREAPTLVRPASSPEEWLLRTPRPSGNVSEVLLRPSAPEED